MGAAASNFFTPYADIQYGFLDAELAIEDLHELAAKGKYHCVSKRLKHGLDPNGKMVVDNDAYVRGDTPMICAARGYLWNKGRKRHLKTLELLLQFGANVNQCNVLEQRPLIVACDRNLLLIASWLIAHGADVNISDKVGVSPLVCAYRNQNGALVRLLLEHGANVVQAPKQFSCLKPPVLPGEAEAAERGNQVQAATSDRDASHSSNNDGDSDRATRRDQAAATQQFALRVAHELKMRVEQQCADRSEMLVAIENETRIAAQRVYRTQLAAQVAKHKQQRRETRSSATYQQSIEKKERKRLAPAVASSVINSSRVNTDVRQLQQPARVITTPELLRWEKAAQHRSSGRPQWVAREVSIAQQATTNHGRNSGIPVSSTNDKTASTLLQQCERMHDSLERAANIQRMQQFAIASPAKHSMRPETAP